MLEFLKIAALVVATMLLPAIAYMAIAKWYEWRMNAHLRHMHRHLWK